MKTETIFVENLKCKGCANTVKNAVSSILGVETVEVYNDQFKVMVEYDDRKVTHEDIAHKLAGIGYPEKGDTNSLVTKAISYVSCAIGRLTPDETLN